MEYICLSSVNQMNQFEILQEKQLVLKVCFYIITFTFVKDLTHL